MTVTTPVTRLDAAEMALRVLELEHEAVRHTDPTSDRYIELMRESDRLQGSVRQYIYDVEQSRTQIGQKGPQQYMIDACVMLNAAMMRGIPEPHELEQAANAASLALSTMRNQRR